MIPEYKFDRTAFKKGSFKEAEKDSIFAPTVSYSDRLRQAYYLILQAYGFAEQAEPQLDRQVFSCRKMNINGKHI